MPKTTTDPHNKECPECKRPMSWTEGLLSDSGVKDIVVGRYSCLSCRLSEKPQESKGVSVGRVMAHDLVGVDAMDKQITRLPTAVQIGILRERQHCAT